MTQNNFRYPKADTGLSFRGQGIIAISTCFIFLKTLNIYQGKDFPSFNRKIQVQKSV